MSNTIEPQVAIHNHSSHKELLKNYHDQQTDPDNNEYISASKIKAALSKSWFSGSTATKKGDLTHNYIHNKVVYGHCAVENAPRAKTKAYDERLAELEVQYPNGNFVMAPPSEITDLCEHLPRLSKFLNDHKGLSETVAYVSNRQETPKVSSKSKEIIDWVRRSGYGLKACVDYLSHDGRGEYRIVDFKTASKTSLNEILSQIIKLKYIFQLYYYRAVLEASGFEVSSKATLYFLLKNGQQIKLDIDLEDTGIFERYVKPHLNKPLNEHISGFYSLFDDDCTHTIKSNDGFLEVDSVGHVKTIKNEKIDVKGLDFTDLLE